MPISAPQRQAPELQKRPMKFVVLLGPEDGSAPTLDDEVDWLEVQSISLSAGGSRVDSLACRYNLPLAEQRLQDTTAPIAFKRQVEIRILDEEGEPKLVAAWGFIAIVDEQVGDGESLQLTARIDKHHFGQPFKAHRYWDHHTLEFVEVMRPCVINPEIDGKIVGNRAIKEVIEPEGEEEEVEGLGEDDPFAFLDPESVRTTQSQSLQANVGEPALWKPSQIVHTICWQCNPDETYVLNPTLEELAEAFGGDDDSTNIKNLALPYGDYLPAQLDRLLRPLHFGWYLDHSLNDDDERETRLRFYRRGEGDLVRLRMQRVGELLDARKSDLPAAKIGISLVDLANKITGRGSFKRHEVTQPLYPGWHADHDDTQLAATEFDPNTIQQRPMVGRKYAVNEAGDLAEPFRPELSGESFFDPPRFTDLRPILGENSLIVRRRFHPCLTTRQPAPEDGEPTEEAASLRYWVEYWDRNYVEDPGGENEQAAVTPEEPDDVGWRRVRSQFAVLDHECGILFSSPQMTLWRLHQEDVNPPADWTENPENEPDHPGLHLRITACLDGDERLEATADRRDTSPNGLDVELVLDLADRFHWRQVHTSSIFYDEDGDATADERDDTDDLAAYVEKVRNTEDAALVSCSLTLPGCDHADLAIGQLIEKLEGREISLDANAPDEGEPRRLQIVGFNVTLGQTQQTELLLETFREEQT